MEFVSSICNLYNAYSSAQKQFKAFSARLNYQIKKAEHLARSQKAQSAPQFMRQNLQQVIEQAKEWLQKLHVLLRQENMSTRKKILLSLPFDKTEKQIRDVLDRLDKAQSDVNNLNTSESQDNGKRKVKCEVQISEDLKNSNNYTQKQKLQKPTNLPQDEDIDEVFMGPTIQEDAAIDFSKNRYIEMTVTLQGSEEIISTIHNVEKKILQFNTKKLIKFDKENQAPEIQLFSLGRIYFKPVYKKLKQIFPEIDKISKENHFTINMCRFNKNIQKKQRDAEETNSPADKMQQKIERQKSQKVQVTQQFFSFPQTVEHGTKMQAETLILRRGKEKNIYTVDAIDMWRKMQELEKEISKGQLIAPFLSQLNQNDKPSLYFKVDFEIVQ